MDSINNIQKSLHFIQTQISVKPKIGVVLGSGLGSFVNEISIEKKIPFQDIPNFSAPSVEGHQGNLLLGHIKNTPLIALQGRLHFYEGHSMEKVVLPIRLMALLGIETLILTNSAGGMGNKMKAGDFMIITDHINFTGTNPLIGVNNKSFGPRFPDMSEAYNKKLSEKLAKVMKKQKVRFHRGVYGGLTGPTYETPAEVRFLKKAGCSAVGMSTVSECIVANHMGVKVVGISCISNLAAGIAKHKLSHEDVTETAKRVEKSFCRILKSFIEDHR